MKRHSVRCDVCKSPNRNDLEQMFADGASEIACAQSYGFQKDTVNRHMRAFGLRDARLNDTLGCLQRVISRGMDNLSDTCQPVGPDTVVRALVLQAEIKKLIRKQQEKADPLVVVLNSFPAETRDKLLEVAVNYNRIEGVVKGGGDG